jgi:hypothetical protein
MSLNDIPDVLRATRQLAIAHLERLRLFRLPEFTATAEFDDHAGQPIAERSW